MAREAFAKRVEARDGSERPSLSHSIAPPLREAWRRRGPRASSGPRHLCWWHDGACCRRRGDDGTGRGEEEIDEVTAIRDDIKDAIAAAMAALAEYENEERWEE